MDNYNLPSYFRLAKLAKEHSNHRYKVGSVIVRRRPISIGFNQIKTHTLYSDGKRYFSIHAEASSLIKAKRDVVGSTIYIYREDSQEKPALARPCKECLKLLIEFGIRRIYFTTSIEPFYERIDL